MKEPSCPKTWLKQRSTIERVILRFQKKDIIARDNEILTETNYDAAVTRCEWSGCLCRGNVASKERWKKEGNYTRLGVPR